MPSPEPRRVLEIEPITWLLDRGAVVICAGGGGIPTMYPSSGPGELVGVEAVIDKDLASELVAEDVGADLFVMATDVDGVYVDWGTPEQRRLDVVTPGELSRYEFAAGSMGPKVEAASRFVSEDRPAGRDRRARRHHRDRRRRRRHQRRGGGPIRLGARPQGRLRRTSRKAGP